MTRTLVVAALLLATAGYLIYPSQDKRVETASPAKAVDLALPANHYNELASDFVHSQLEGGVDGGESGSDLTDEDTSLHIGEFIDADNPPALRSAEPLHIGEFADPDAPMYATEDEAIHIGEDLSAYDPIEYISEDDEPLHLGQDLSAYDPLDIISGAVDTEDKHIGEPIHEPL